MRLAILVYNGFDARRAGRRATNHFNGVDFIVSEKTPNTSQIWLYLSRQADSLWHYLLEQTLQFVLGWIPTTAGIALRAVFYRLMLKMDGVAAIERNVRLRFASRIHLGRGAYLDENVYIHACPQGVEIGEKDRKSVV